MKTITVTQLRSEFARAKREANDGPVLITERGRPAYVLMSYQHYLSLPGVVAEQERAADISRELV